MRFELTSDSLCLLLCCRVVYHLDDYYRILVVLRVVEVREKACHRHCGLCITQQQDTQTTGSSTHLRVNLSHVRPFNFNQDSGASGTLLNLDMNIVLSQLPDDILLNLIQYLDSESTITFIHSCAKFRKLLALKHFLFVPLKPFVQVIRKGKFWIQFTEQAVEKKWMYIIRLYQPSKQLYHFKTSSIPSNPENNKPEFKI